MWVIVPLRRNLQIQKKHYSSTVSMDGGGAPQAAVSGAVLGSRNGRRQVRAALAYASEYGAYSVGFALVRGGLAGFTVYLEGRHAGSAAKRSPLPMAAVSAMGPVPGHRRPDFGFVQPCAHDAASGQQRRRQEQQQQHKHPSTGAADGGPACACGAATAPTAARRMRGCRGGAKRRAQRAAGVHLSAAAPAAQGNTTEGSQSCAAVVPAGVEGHGSAVVAPPAPSAPSKGSSSSLLSHSAIPFTPFHKPSPSLPPPHASSASSSMPPLLLLDPSLPSDLDTLHLLPHARLSYEEMRWEHYTSVLPTRSSQKRRAPSPPSAPPPPPDPPPPPPSAVVGCVVNERPSPPPPRPSRERERVPRASWDYSARFLDGLARSRSGERGAGGRDK